MNFEYDIPKEDLANRDILLKMSKAIENFILSLSNSARSSLRIDIENLRVSFESLNNAWLKVQRDKILDYWFRTSTKKISRAKQNDIKFY
jgi:hypothetical protein